MEAHGEVGGSSNGNGKDVAGGSGMTTRHDPSQSAPIPGPGYIFTGKITDPWSHAAHNGRQGFSCHYCGRKRLGGGSTRLKEHLGGLGGSVVQCDKVPSEVQAAMRKNRLDYKQKKSKVQARKLRLDLELLEEMGGSPVIDLDPASDEEDRVRLEREKSLRGVKLRNAVESMGSMGSRFEVGSGSGSANVESSPMTPANGKITQYLHRKSSLSPADGGTGTPASGKKGRQPRIDFSNQKLNAAKLGQAWAKWFHANDIPGWKINCPLFRAALKSSQELHAVKHLPRAYEVDGIYRNSRSESEPLLDEGGSPSQFVHDIVRDVCSKRKTVKVSSLVRTKRVKKGKMAVLDEEGEASESEDYEEEDQENCDEYVPMDVLGERWVAPQSLREFIIARSAKFSTLLAWIKRDPFESHLSHLSILRIFVRDVRQEDLEILARLPALRRLSLRQEDLEIQRQLVVSDYGFRCLTSFELFTEFLGHIVFQPGALPKAKQVRFSIGLRAAKEPAAGNGGDCFDLGLGNLRSLREVLIAAIRWGKDTEQVEDALEDALMHAISAHPNCPRHQLITVPNMKRLMISLPAAIPNYTYER